MARIKLKLDFESMFPGEEYDLCGQIIPLRPLGIVQLASISKKVKSFIAALQERDITFDNYESPERLLDIAVLLLDQFPDVLEEASNISLDDLQHIPF
jgi:hypothetical protein